MRRKENGRMITWKKTAGKRALSVALSCVLALGNVPGSVLAGEVDPESVSYGLAEEESSQGGEDHAGQNVDVSLNLNGSSSEEEEMDEQTVPDDPQPDPSANLNVSTGDEQDPSASLEPSSSGVYEDVTSDPDHMEVSGDENPDELDPADNVSEEDAAAFVITRDGTTAYADMASAWDAALAAGDATIEMKSDWASDSQGSFGSGGNFSPEGSIVMDGYGAQITIEADGHAIFRDGEMIPGGCVFGVFDGTLVIKDAVISGGNSTSDGGGFLVVGGRLELDDVIVSGNHAGAGGGLSVTGGSVTLRNSRVAGNTSDNLGSGIFINTDTAELTLMGMVDVSGNNPSLEGDVFLAGSAPVSIDSLAPNSYITVGSVPFEGSRVIGRCTEASAGCLVSRMEGYEVRWENGEALLAPVPQEPEEGSVESDAADSEMGAEEEEQKEVTETEEDDTGTEVGTDGEDGDVSASEEGDKDDKAALGEDETIVPGTENEAAEEEDEKSPDASETENKNTDMTDISDTDNHADNPDGEPSEDHETNNEGSDDQNAKDGGQEGIEEQDEEDSKPEEENPDGEQSDEEGMENPEWKESGEDEIENLDEEAADEKETENPDEMSDEEGNDSADQDTEENRTDSSEEERDDSSEETSSGTKVANLLASRSLLSNVSPILGAGNENTDDLTDGEGSKTDNDTGNRSLSGGPTNPLPIVGSAFVNGMSTDVVWLNRVQTYAPYSWADEKSRYIYKISGPKIFAGSWMSEGNKGRNSQEHNVDIFYGYNRGSGIDFYTKGVPTPYIDEFGGRHIGSFEPTEDFEGISYLHTIDSDSGDRIDYFNKKYLVRVDGNYPIINAPNISTDEYYFSTYRGSIFQAPHISLLTIGEDLRMTSGDSFNLNFLDSSEQEIVLRLHEQTIKENKKIYYYAVLDGQFATNNCSYYVALVKPGQVPDRLVSGAPEPGEAICDSELELQVYGVPEVTQTGELNGKAVLLDTWKVLIEPVEERITNVSYQIDIPGIGGTIPEQVSDLSLSGPGVALDNASVEVKWVPEDKKVRPNRNYVVSVNITPPDGYIFTDSVKVLAIVNTVNTLYYEDVRRNPDGTITHSFCWNTGGSLDTTVLDDLVYPNGTARSAIHLPEEIMLKGADGEEYIGKPVWDESKLVNYDPLNEEEQKFLLETKEIILPVGVTSDQKLEAKVQVIVTAADDVQPPMASPEAGVYTSEQKVVLYTNQDNVKIKYKVHENDTFKVFGGKNEEEGEVVRYILVTEDSPTIWAKCVKVVDGEETERESLPVKFTYKFEKGKHRVKVVNGYGSGLYAPGETVRIFAYDKNAIKKGIDMGKSIAEFFGYGDKVSFLDKIPGLDSSAGEFKGWKVVIPENSGVVIDSTLFIDQVGTFTMPDFDVQIEAVFENTNSTPDPGKAINRVDISMNRTPKPGRNKLSCTTFYISTPNVSWAGADGLSALFPETAATLKAVKIMPFVSSFGTIGIFNGLFDGWDTTVFQFNESYTAEFPLVAANGYYFSDNLEVYVDGEKAQRGGNLVSIVMGALNSLIGYQAYTAQFTWKMRKARVLEVDDLVELDELPNGTSLRTIGEKIRQKFGKIEYKVEEPAEISFDEITDDTVKSEVDWNTTVPSEGSYDPSNKNEQTFRMKGYLERSIASKYDAEGFVDSATGRIPVYVVVTVAAADTAAKPGAAPDPGTYQGTTSVTLTSTEEDATIYYTMDGSDPKTSVTRKIYAGPITLPEEPGQTKEYQINAYTVKGGKKDSGVNTFLYKIEPGVVNITIEKQWMGDKNAVSLRPDSVTFTLYGDGKELQKITLTSTNEVPVPAAQPGTGTDPTDETLEANTPAAMWAIMLKNLPEKDSSGNVISYSLLEDDVPNYKKSVSMETIPESSGQQGNQQQEPEAGKRPGDIIFTAINTLDVETTSVKGHIEWKDDQKNADGNRPKEVYLKLYDATGMVAEKTVTEDTNWMFSIDGLVKDTNANYSLVQGVIPAYEEEISKITDGTEDFVIVNTYVPQIADIPVEKIWEDDDDVDGLRPEEVTVRLYYTLEEKTESEDSGQEGSTDDTSTGGDTTDPDAPVQDPDTPAEEPKEPVVVDTGVTLVLNAENEWKGVFEGQKTFLQGKNVLFTAKEETVPEGYEEITEADKTSLVITNRHVSDRKDIHVSIVWEDNADAEHTRPAQIVLTALSGETEAAQLTLTADDADPENPDQWLAVFRNIVLPEEVGKVVYSVKEDEVENYRVIYGEMTEGEDYTVTITNRLIKDLPKYDKAAFGLNAPEADKTLVDKTTGEIAVTSTSDAGPDPITLAVQDIRWQPADDPVKKNTRYIAAVTLTPGEDWNFDETVTGVITVQKPDGTTEEIEASAERQEDGSVTFSLVLTTEGTLTVQDPDDQIYPNGIDRENIFLPETVTILEKVEGEEGSEESFKEYTAVPTWDTTDFDKYDPAIKERQEFTITSTDLQLPPGMASAEPLTATFKVIIEAADAVQPPMAVPGSGSFTAAQNVVLITEQKDAEIWYCVTDEGKDPGEFVKYDGNLIAITKTSVVHAKCVKIPAKTDPEDGKEDDPDAPQETETLESEVVKFTYKIEVGKHHVKVINGSGSGNYAPGETVYCVAYDKNGLATAVNGAVSIGKSIASFFGYDDVSKFLGKIPSMDESAGKFKGWKVIRPESGLLYDNMLVSQVISFTMPDGDVEIEAEFENTTTEPDPKKEIKRVDITMNRTPKPGRNKVSCSTFYITTSHVSWAGTDGISALFPEATATLKAVRIMPFVSRFGTIGIFNGLFDEGWFHTDFQFGESYSAEFPLVAAEGYYFSDDLEVYVDGEKAEKGNGFVTIVLGALESVLGYQAYTAKYTWNMRKAKVLEIKEPDEKEFPNGTSLKDIVNALPGKLDVVVEDEGIITEISDETVEYGVEWNAFTPSDGSYDPSKLSEQRFRLKGYMDRDLADDYDASGFTEDGKVPAYVVITVLEAGKLTKPEADPKSGTYEGTQKIVLTDEDEDATIYYTLDGSDPRNPDNSARKVFNDHITLPQVDGETVEYQIIAYAEKGGMKPSNLATFHYEIAPATLDIVIVKKWEDEGDTSSRPKSVTFTLLENGANGRDVVLSPTMVDAEGSWTLTLADQPEVLKGREVSYNLIEKETAGYESALEKTVGENGEIIFTVTNTLVQETVTLKGHIEWSDSRNADINRPAEVKLSLYNEDGLAAEQTVTAATNWRFSFVDVPKNKGSLEYNYSLTQDDIPGYETDVNEPADTTKENFVVLNTYVPQLADITVQKVWEDGDDVDKIRPAQVTVHLYRAPELTKEPDAGDESGDGGEDGENGTGEEGGDSGDEESDQPVEPGNEGEEPTDEPAEPELEDTGLILSLTEEDDWKGVFEGQKTLLNGQKQLYYVQEETVPEGYEAEMTREKDTSLILTNRHEPDAVDVTVFIAWKDVSNAKETRPESVSVTLFADGEEYETRTLTADDEDPDDEDLWRTVFEGLLVNNDGTKITYTVTQEELEDYQTAAGEMTETEEGQEITFTNTLEEILTVYDKAAFGITGPAAGEEFILETTGEITLGSSQEGIPEITLPVQEVKWDPVDSPAKKNTAYVAIVILAPEEDWVFEKEVAGTVTVTKPDGTTEEVSCTGERNEDGTVTFLITLSTEGVLTAQNPADQIYPNGVKRDLITLPDTVVILDEEGNTYSGDVLWDESALEDYDPSKRERQEFVITSSQILPPAGMASEEPLTASFKVIVEAADAIQPPVATPGTGTYSSDQSVALYTDQTDVDIYYTLTPEGEEEGEFVKYDGNPIVVTKNSVIAAKCVKITAPEEDPENPDGSEEPENPDGSGDTEEPELEESEVARFTYTIERGKHHVKVINGMGSGDYAPGETVYAVAYDKKTLQKVLDKTKAIASLLGFSEVSMFLSILPSMDDAGDFKGWETHKPDGLSIEESVAPQMIRFIMPDEDVEIEALFEKTSTEPDEKKVIKRVDITMFRAPKPGRMKVTCQEYLITTDHVSFAGTGGLNDVFGDEDSVDSVGILPLVTSIGIIPYFNNIVDSGWLHTDFQFGESYTAEFPLVAAHGYYFAQDVEVYIDGNKAERGDKLISIIVSMAHTLTGYQGYTAKYTWDMPKAKLLDVYEPDEMEFENGTSLKDIGKDLPDEVEIKVEDEGIISEVSDETLWKDVTWDTIAPSEGSYDPSSKNEQRFKMKGYLDRDLKDTYDVDALHFADSTSRVPVSVIITVKAADSLAKPTADPEPGTYEGTQTITLKAKDEDATIYYTLDGSDPTLVDNSARKIYAGHITLPQSEDGPVEYQINAYCVKSGKKDSGVASFLYTINSSDLDIVIIKKWEDADNEEGLRPVSVSFDLLVNGVADRTVVLAQSMAGEDGSWILRLQGMPKTAKGRDIAYAIVEKELEGYSTTVLTETGEDGTITFTVTNTIQPVQIDVTGTVEWEDEDDADGKRPKNVTIHLLADDEEKDSQTVSADAEGKWNFSFTGLDKYAGGEEIKYTVTEGEVEEYTTEIEEFTITNAHTAEKTEVSGTKIWEDEDDKEGARPESITVRLLANGEEADSLEVKADEEGSWTYSFSDLPKYADGAEIVYTITEDPVEDYQFEVSGYDLTNRYTPGMTNVSGVKTWTDAENQDGKRPESITIHLLADGEEIDSKTVTAEDEWQWNFTDLNVKKNGEEIEYTITEDEVPDYETSVDGFNVTNTYEPETTEVGGTKTWEDNDNQDGKRPESITINLLADGEEVQTAEVSADNNGLWSYSFAGQPKYADGKEIEYTITEEEVAGYETTVDGFDVTNTYEAEKFDITGTKTWEDADDQDGIRPESININLLAFGVEVQNTTVTEGEDGTWTYSFPDLDRYQDGSEIQYTVTEDEVEGYEASVDEFKITNTHEPSLTSVSGTKTWDDGDDQDGLRPESITIRLYADEKELEDKALTVEPDEDGNWTYSFEDLPKYADGKEIEYTISEDEVEGYETSVNGFDITNTHETSLTSVSGTKTWEDNDDQDGLRPANIIIHLLADGKETDSQTVTADENGDWTYSFTDLPKYADGKEIDYTIAEDEVEGYETSVDGFNVTNTHVPEKIEDIVGTKTWDDEKDAEGLRPESITIRLYADGKELKDKVQTVKPDKDGNWTYSFTGLDKYAAGQEIVYTISEDLVDDYQSEIDGFDVTNTCTPGKTNVTGVKTWDDADDQDGRRPEKITIHLLANDEETNKSQTVTAEDDWRWNFTDLPVEDENGEEIEYSISEDAVDGYEEPSVNVNGFNVTNTHRAETTEVSGKKTWEDADDQDGLRPESITIRLLADGEEVRNTTVVEEKGEWTYSFRDLPKYAEGKEISYTVKEDAVPGYESSVDGFDMTNTHVPEKIKAITGTKTWEDADDQDGRRPESITIRLLADDKEVEGQNQTVTPDEKGEWTWTFEDLPKYAEGKEIKYTISEDAVDGYETIVDGFNVTNTYEPEKIEAITGTKTWEDADDQDGLRPKNIIVNLLANGKPVDSQTVSPNESGEWAYSFTDLPKFGNGEEIEYTVAEEAVDGYDTSVDGFNITNTHEPGKIDVSGSKTWEDNDDQDGLRPKSIGIRLLANGKEVEGRSQTVTPDEKGEWTWIFTDLPKCANGKEISYVAAEDPVEGYEAVVKGMNVTNVHDPERIESISGTKTWDDQDDQDGRRPEEITIRLLANGKETDSRTVTARIGWSYSFKNLPRYAGGEEIVYTITEDPVTDYQSEINGFDVTNSCTPGKTNVSGMKTWKDHDDQDGRRPEEITINLLADGEPVDSKTVTAKDEWKWNFTDLDEFRNGEKIEYTITEEEVPGYETEIDGFNVINTYETEKTEVSGTKTWEDEDNREGLRPDSIIIHLLADGKEISSQTVTANEDDEWSYTFTDLDTYADGKKIEYTITEEEVTGYKTTVDGFDVTNTRKTEKTEVSGAKTWDDAEDQDGRRPESITINLLANGSQIDSKVVTAKDKWTWNFTDLDVYADGREITYMISEDPVKDYQSKVEGFDVINTYTPGKTNVSGVKTWDDADDQDGIRPDSIIIRLLADGKEIESKTVTAKDEWKWNFTDLDASKAGKEITYTITEDKVPGYESTVEGYNVTNKHVPETTEVSGTKTWEDHDDQDGRRPKSITINLMADGSEIANQTVTPNENGEWTWTFADLAVNKDGKKITYSITEETVPDYEAEIDGFNVTNTYEPEMTEVSGTKTWDDADNQDRKRPKSIMISLLADGTKIDSREVTKKDDWRYRFTDLPRYTNGREIVYTIIEDAVTDYQSAYDGYDVTNTYTPGKTNVAGVKTWDDADDQDGIRPESITVSLFADGTKIDSQTVTAEDGWRWNFTDLDESADGEKIVYTVTEDPVKGYETSYDGFNIVNTHTPEIISISVTKTWDDADDQDGLRPDNITINLLADGTKIANQTVSADGNGDWSCIFTDLPKNIAGQEIEYTITEGKVDGYETEIDGFDVVNTHEPEKTEVSGTKTWDDNEDQDGKRPETITVNLLTNGKKTDSKTVTGNKDGLWAYSFTNLDKYAKGKEIVYTITEDAVADYQSSYDGYDITNRYTPGKTNVSGMKIWEDNENQDGTRPKSITVRLLADGKEVDSKTVTASDDWKWNFTDLDVAKDGQEIEYTITEDPVKGYESKADGFNVINTRDSEKMEISGTKTWDDNDDQDGKRPDIITINLLANGKKKQSAEVTADTEGNWTYTFSGLDRYADGQEIEYTITEGKVDGYETTVDGYDVTNVHTPEKIEISGTKTWDDANDRAGARPKAITIHLLADGQIVDSKTVAERDQWSYRFTGLDRYADGREIVYSISEDTVKDYQSEFDGYDVTNHYTPGKTNVAGIKTWKDENNADGRRPDSITINLLADDEQIDSKTVTEEDGWRWNFTDLDEMKDGRKIVYTITEDEVEGYESTTDGYNVTNTCERSKTEVSGEKTWDDNDDQEGKRPESITVNLLADGKKVQNTTVKESPDGSWKYQFTDLDSFADGKEITYTVTEDPVDGYEGSVDGFDITNTYVPEEPEEEEIRISGQVFWEDEDDKEGRRPEQTIVNLFADDMFIGETKVKGSPNGVWLFDFGKQIGQKDGKAVAYSLTEDTIEGYKTTITFEEQKSGDKLIGIVYKITNTLVTPTDTPTPTPGGEGTITPKPPTPTPGGEGTITPKPPTPTPGGEGTITPKPPTPTPGGEGTITPKPPTPTPGGEGTITPKPPTPTPGGEGTITPKPPTPTPGGEGTITPKPPTPTPGGEGTITPEPPTPTPGGEGTITPEPPTPTPGGDTPINPSITPGGSGDIEYMYVYGEILWEDSDNAYNTRPSEATVRLVRGSTIVEEIVVEPDSDGKWLYSFDPVPRYGISGSTPQEVSQSGELPEAGASGSARNKGDREELVYTLKQKDVEGYNWYTTILSSQINDDTLDVSTTVTDVLKSRSTVTPTTGPDEDQPSNNNNNSNSGHSTIVNSNTSYGGSSSSRTGSGKTTTSPIVKESGRSTVSNASNASNAKTGDETDLMLLFSMLGLSLMVILYCRKRKTAR